MPDIINLLPDSVANQIAAGEVVQRPASVVKELLENSVDAGSTSIKLIIKDAGKTLIQIIDNGCGMSETDARKSFERHATSKISQANDLFAIKTFGFRGEALASIAAIAHVEMKTRRVEDELGSHIILEGSKVQEHEPCSCSEGTSIAVKNLFFNVPARRNFLKSNSAETRHIIEEFQRVALSNPGVELSMFHNGNEVYHLLKGSLRQRITGVFGNSYNQRLVPVKEDTDIVNLDGFVVKPEFARKSRGEQFFFVNNRFIKSPYLQHAVKGAFEDLISDDSFPSYFLFMEVNPQTIDINIHPTKTEIKFENEKAIYAIIRSTVKRALSKHNIAPSLDFDHDEEFNPAPIKSNGIIKQPEIRVNPNYNPFEQKEKVVPIPSESNGKSSPSRVSSRNWHMLYEEMDEAREKINTSEKSEEQMIIAPDWNEHSEKSEISSRSTFQVAGKFLVTTIKSGIVVIDQQAAHERVLFEQFMEAFNRQKSASQQLLFPQTLEFNPAEHELVKELEGELTALGFDLREFGKNTYVLHGVPADVSQENPKEIIDRILEHYNQNMAELKLKPRENLARSVARSMAIKQGKSLSQDEMSTLIDQLFACAQPSIAPNSRPAYITIKTGDIEKKFG